MKTQCGTRKVLRESPVAVLMNGGSIPRLPTTQNIADMKCYIGIDVGSKGFITVCTPEGEYSFLSIESSNEHQINEFLQEITDNYKSVFCAMEEVHAIFGSSAKATFAFGEINGLLKGFLIANNIPFELVPPKRWQGEIWRNSDMVYEYKVANTKEGAKTRKTVNTKQTSYNAARRIFPTIDLRKSDRAKKFDDNKVDSLLICEYARRKNL